MKSKLNWEAFSNRNRIEVIEEVKQLILDHDGYIIHFKMFSDLALNLNIEIEADKIPTLHQALSSKMSISELENHLFDSKKEWLIFIHLSFGQSHGNLRHEIPEVPG